LARLRKRSGELEEFSEAKLRASLTSAGASEEHARTVSESVARSSTEGMATAEIRRLAASELGRLDNTAAQKYEAFTKR
jgi:2-phosphoglycerate kinase